jgi:hypothetical protein
MGNVTLYSSWLSLPAMAFLPVAVGATGTSHRWRRDRKDASNDDSTLGRSIW